MKFAIERSQSFVLPLGGTYALQLKKDDLIGRYHSDILHVLNSNGNLTSDLNITFTPAAGLAVSEGMTFSVLVNFHHDSGGFALSIEGNDLGSSIFNGLKLLTFVYINGSYYNVDGLINYGANINITPSI